MSQEKPWEQTIASIWRWLVKGWKKFVTIPVFVVMLIIPIIFNDSYKEFFSFVKGLFERKRSYPTKDELDVFNEWVVLVSVVANKDEAEKQFQKFRKTYATTGHAVWNNDILLVRNPKKEMEWQIVIDTYPGPSTTEDVQGAIDNMWRYCKIDRDIENTLGRWVYSSRPILYDSTAFVKTYGRIVKE